MNHLTAIRTAVLGGLLVCGPAFAQHALPLVITDAAPLPAEDRSSTGAILLDNSPVRAQRDRDSEAQGPMSRAQEQKAAGRGALRATLREQAKADLKKQGEAEALDFYERRSGSLK